MLKIQKKFFLDTFGEIFPEPYYSSWVMWYQLVHDRNLNHQNKFNLFFAASVLSIPARIFPIYFPFGNLATGFFLIFSLIAGVVGFITSFTGIHNVIQWNAPNLHAAAASSLVTWTLTLLAMGLACKEINVGWTDSNLRTLETIMILVSGTQLFCMGAIHAGVEDVVGRQMRGRVWAWCIDT